MNASQSHFQSGKYGYRTISGAMKDILVRDKLTGLYRGLVVTIARDAPFSGLYLAAYTQMKTKAFEDPGWF